MATVTFTHYGWFGLCPIIIADPEAETPTFQARYKYTEWLFDFSDWMYDRCNDFLLWMDKEHDPVFPYSVSGELDKPIILSADEEED